MHPRRSAHILTVAILTSALCADRLSAAMPGFRTQEVSSLAERLLDRLSVGLRRGVTVIRTSQGRLNSHRARVFPIVLVKPQIGVLPQVGVFQFRLPPPARPLI